MAIWGNWGATPAAPNVAGLRKAPTVPIQPQVAAMPSWAKAQTKAMVSPLDTSAIGKAKSVGYLSGPPKSPLVDESQDGFLNKPGTGEQWFADHQSDVNAPSRMSTFLPAATGRLLGMNYQPDNASGAYGKMSSELGTPGQGVTNAWGVSQQLRSPTQGEGVMGQAASMFDGPNLAHNYATDTAAQFRTPGASENYFGQTAPQLQQQGQGETNAYSLLNQFKAPGAAEDNLGVTDAALGKINYGAMGINAANKNLTNDASAYFRGAVLPGSLQNTVGDESQNFLPGLRNLSNSEQLYNSGGGNGLDSAYQRSTDKATRELQTKMAATGMFGSGTTARGLEEIYADSAANQARDQASLAAQADQAQLGRTAAAQSFSGAAGQEALARLGLGMSGATAADESGRGNVNAMLNATGQASTEALGKVAARTTSSTAAENAQLDRLFKSGQTGLAADQQGLNRITEGGNLAHNAAIDQIQRLLGGSQVAEAGDRSLFAQGTGLGAIGNNMANAATNRLTASATTGVAGDNARTAQLQALMQGATSLDDLRQKAAQLGINIEDVLGKINSQADQNDWQRTTDRQTMANGVQNLFQGRYQTQLDNTLKVGGAQAGAVTDASGKMSDEQAQIARDQINGMIKSGAMTQQQGDQLIGELFQGAGIGAQIYKTASGGK